MKFFFTLNKFDYMAGVVTVMTPALFFAIHAILSIEYLGFNESNSYIISLLSTSFLFIIGYIKSTLVKRRYLLSEVLSLFVIIVVFLYLSFLFLVDKSFNSSVLFQFSILVIPSALFAIKFGQLNNPDSIFKYFFVVSQVILLSILMVIPKMIVIDVVYLTTFFGGGHYQGFAYIVSFSYLINLIYLLFYVKNKKNIYLFCFYTSFLVHIAAIILSGARGSILVVLFGTIISLYIKHSFKFVLFIFGKILIVSIPLFIVLLNLLNSYSDRILESAERLFSYFSDGSIDITKTSNRDILYTEAINLILNRPFLGYGFFDYQNHTGFGYPHNFFLEVLLQGGMFYLMVWILLFASLFFRFSNLLRKDKKHVVILPFLVYSFILLLFSGTYLLEPFFWITIIYIFVASSKYKNITS
jgi:O-antigen ligase